MVRWCWVNFHCRGVLLIWIKVGQGPIALAVGAGGGCLDIFSLSPIFSLLAFPPPPLWETARYRLEYCLKRPLNPNQPTYPLHILQGRDIRCASHMCYLFIIIILFRFIYYVAAWVFVRVRACVRLYSSYSTRKFTSKYPDMTKIQCQSPFLYL